MRQLSAAGQSVVNDLAYRHQFSPDAVSAMLDAVVNGNGGMAQFSHPEFGGSGQWMRGGMTMIGDMFNNNLKYRVDALCNDLSALIANQPDLIRTGSFQSQSQGGYAAAPSYPQAGGGLFVAEPSGGSSGNWWPQDLGWPNSTGSQNNERYAYFAQSRRLAIDTNGTVTVYDTLDHQIGGVSQQQSYGGALTFTSQYGTVNVASLPVVSVNGEAPGGMAPAPASFGQSSSPPPASFDGGSGSDVFAMIEKLGELRGKGLLSDAEFDAKKAELLGRI